MSASSMTRQASAWVYEGVWAVLSGLFRVPRQPPHLPLAPGEEAIELRLAEGWLRWRKLVFWVVLVLIDVVLIAAWVALLARPDARLFALLTAPLWWAVIILPDILAYVAIHLEYDTTWYTLTSRSMRLRRGIWSITETTITFENVQNVRVEQGPLQRLFGFSNLIVETAGGGGAAGPHAHAAGAHMGLLAGIEDAPAVKQLIMARARGSRFAGLGDEGHAIHLGAHSGAPASAAGGSWTGAHLEALREIARHAADLRARRA